MEKLELCWALKGYCKTVVKNFLRRICTLFMLCQLSHFIIQHIQTLTHTHTESTEKLFGLLRGCIFRVMKSHDQTKAACLPRFFALGTVLPPTLTHSLKVKLL